MTLVSTPIKVGDRVKYRAEFLRSVGAYTGPMPFVKGTVTEFNPDIPAIAHVDWNLQGIPTKVNVFNLIHADRIEPV